MAYESCCGKYHACPDWTCPYRRKQYGWFKLHLQKMFRWRKAKP